VLSNFQSLQAAIEAKNYAIDFSTLAHQNLKPSPGHKYDYLIRRGLQLAADLLKQTHSQTRGRDGYVQIDLPPHSLLHGQSAIAEAQILWCSVGWCNLMLRIPAAQILLPVIAQLICDRINVNTTFVFSQTTYEQVGDDYLPGLESLIQQGESVSEIACFTSFSIARLDTVIHPLLDKIKIRGEWFSLTPAIFCLPFNLPIVAISRHRSDAIAPKNTCRCGGSKSRILPANDRRSCKPEMPVR
jgi:transaldolase